MTAQACTHANINYERNMRTCCLHVFYVSRSFFDYVSTAATHTCRSPAPSLGGLNSNSPAAGELRVRGVVRVHTYYGLRVVLLFTLLYRAQTRTGRRRCAQCAGRIPGRKKEH